MIKRKHTWKPGSIIDVIQRVEQCKLLSCNKTRGHYIFYRKELNSPNPHLCLDECFISCMLDKEKQELHLFYYFVKTSNISKRIFK
jgi:hypothetical protein